MPPASQKKVLILSSDSALTATLTDRFHLEGIATLIVSDAGTAVTEGRRSLPVLVIIDVSVDPAGAFEALDLIRRDPNQSFANVPIIIASQNGDLVEIGQALKFGIKDYFVKSSFDPDRVMVKIRGHIDTAVATTPPSVAPSAQSGGASKLLMIEDDKFLRDLATQKFEHEKFTVFSAADGERGVEIAEKEIPDIILLDILLPGIDGFEVLKRIRANSALAKTRVAMFSNFGQRQDVEKALTSGADQFLVKANYTLDEIVEKIRGMLASERA